MSIIDALQTLLGGGRSGAAAAAPAGLPRALYGNDTEPMAGPLTAPAPGEIGSSAPLGVDLPLPPPRPADLGPGAPMNITPPGAPVGGQGADGGTVLARLNGGTPRQQSGLKSMMKNLSDAMAGGESTATPDPFKAFSNGLSTGMKGIQTAAAARAAAERADAKEGRVEARDNERLALERRRTEFQEAESGARTRQGDRRVSAYEKFGGGKPASLVDAMARARRTLGLARTDAENQHGITRDDAALPSQRMTPEKRKAAEAAVEATVEAERQRVKSAMAHDFPDGSGVDDGEATPGAVVSGTVTRNGETTPDPARPPAAAGVSTWRKVRNKDTGDVMEWNEATGAMRPVQE